MEARIARLESDVAHLRSDVGEIKFDSLEAKVDRKVTWLLSFQFATTAGILGAMARGFGWI